MDFVSWFLSLLGLKFDAVTRRADRRAEAYRLVSEVTGDAGRALDIIAMETPSLSRRCAEICPDQPAVRESMLQVMNEQREAASKILAMADDYKTKIATGKNGIDWENLVMRLQEWRATAARMPPWVEGLVQRYDKVLDEAAPPSH